MSWQLLGNNSRRDETRTETENITDGMDSFEFVEEVHPLMERLQHVLSLVGPAKREIQQVQKTLSLTTGMNQPLVEPLPNIAQLKQELEQAKQEIEILKRQAQKKENSPETADVRYTAQIKSLELEVKNLKNETAELQQTLDYEKQAYEDAIQIHKQKIQSQSEEQDMLQAELRKTLKENQEAMSNLSAEKEKVIAVIRSELSDTKIRLSKLMGDKLSKQNPDIADLSEENRPTKIAEKFSELYDNQWTDAFETVEKLHPGKDEDQRVKILIQLLMDVNKFCQEEFRSQEDTFVNAPSCVYGKPILLSGNSTPLNMECLSKLVGDKVSDNNPDIADLGDTNRPTKIAERYHELYDNQWTDAFEITVKYLKDKGIQNTEDQAIKTLLRILLKSFQFCEEKVDKENKELQKMFGKQENNDDIPNSLKMEIKLTRRNNANYAVMKVAEEYISMLKRCNPDGSIILKVLEFVKECVVVCWLMVIQDPKVVLHTLENDGFDSNLYKAYTVSGKTVHFVVWPALLLHRDGPTLAKGIVQCVKETQRKGLTDQSAYVNTQTDRKKAINVLKTQQKEETTEPILLRKQKTRVNAKTALSGLPSIQAIMNKGN